MRAGLGVALALGCLGIVALLRAKSAVPKFVDVRVGYVSSDVFILDRHDEILQQVRLGHHDRSLPWVRLDQVSSALPDAVIRLEDKRFEEHHGIDFFALGSVASHWLESGGKEARGASTITMQLVKILSQAGELQKGHKSHKSQRYVVKLRQLAAAVLLETMWTKAEILEAYLNLAQWRGEFRGIGAAAHALVGKAPHLLDREDGALLAAMLKFPNAQPLRIARRACFALSEGDGCESRIESLLSGYMQHPELGIRVNLAPHLARRLSPGTISTTLDVAIQKKVTEVLSTRLSELQGRNARDGAALVVDIKTGEVLSYVAISGDGTNNFVDGVVARRQAGSTLKPFLYSLAFEKDLITPDSLLDDSPLVYQTTRGAYRPENYDRQFRGLVRARVALGSSLNIPAVRVIDVVGVPAFADRLEQLGFFLPQPPEWYGPALALGSLDVSLWELVHAYGVLGRGGRDLALKIDAGLAPSGGEQSRMDPRAAWVTADILGSQDARALSFGYESPLATQSWAAVKTGTSKDMRDNWCVGFSDQYVVGVWVGNYAGDPMWNVSGISGAAPAWADVMTALHHDRMSVQPQRPEGMEGDVAQEPAPREERLARIVYPTDHLVVALDPDIPDRAQRIGLELEGFLSETMTVEIDDRMLRCPEGRCLFKPIAGLHVISLKDASGRELDRAEFEVRGAALTH